MFSRGLFFFYLNFFFFKNFLFFFFFLGLLVPPGKTALWGREGGKGAGVLTKIPALPVSFLPEL